MIVADFATLAYVAVIFTDVLRFDDVVVTVNDLAVAPAGTVTDAGTVASEGFALFSVTTTPPAGAGAANVTVPDDDAPPTTVEGLRLIDASAGGGGGGGGGGDGGSTVNVVVLVTPS